MKDLWITTRFLLKQNLSLKHALSRMKTDKRFRNMMIVVGIVLLLSLPSFAVFIKMYTELYDIFAEANIEAMYIVIAVIFSLFIIIFFGMFQIISYFYFSNDVKILTPLPIKTSYILISKFVVVYVWQLLISVFTILPFFLIYSIKASIPIYNWITMFVSFLLLPIVPIVIIGFITIAIMSLTKIFHNKDAIRMVGYLLLLIGAVGFQFYINKTLMNVEEGKAADYYLDFFSNNAIIERAESIYPIITFINSSITGNFIEAIVSNIIFFMISIAAVYLFGLFLQAVFLKSYLTEQGNTKVKRKKITKPSSTSHVALAIAKIDFITLLKVPMFALNTLSVVILIPLLLIIMPLASGDQLELLLKFYEPDTRMYFWLIVALFIGIFSSLNPIASTSFSREGKTNWIMRTLPISPKNHIVGRSLTAFFTEIVFAIIMCGILVVTLTSRLELEMLDYVFATLSFIIGITISIPLILAGLYIDLKRPMLKWDNPQQPVKQNMNVLLSMAVGMIDATAMVLLYLLLNSVLSIHLNVVIIILLIIQIAFIYITFNILHKQFEKSLILMIE